MLNCARCKNEITTSKDSLSTGYATNDKQEKICYECCADEDREYMKKNGCITLYLIRNPDGMPKVTNWPGTLSFKTTMVKNGRHNIARIRQDVWFNFEGYEWHGIQLGRYSDICRCRRTFKRKSDYNHALETAERIGDASVGVS